MSSETVRRAIDGEDEAFLEIMEAVKLDLYKTALSYLRNEEEALEAIQEVTYRAYCSLANLKEPAYFKTWMIRIMINYCNDQLKKQKPIVLNNGIVAVEGREDNHDFFELEDVLASLDERSREIIMMKYIHDLKIKEIAQFFDCPEGTIKTWLHKALKSLRKKLTEKGGTSHV